VWAAVHTGPILEASDAGSDFATIHSVSSLQAQTRLLLRIYAISLAVWLPVSVLVGWQTYIMDRREGLPVVLGQLLLAFAARYVTVAILTPPIFYVVHRWPLRGAILRRTAGYAVGYVAFSCAFALIRWLLLPPWEEERLTFGPRSLAALADFGLSTFADVLLLYVVIVAVAHAYTYLVIGRRQEIERLELRQSLAQSELQALRAQLHPHFLFNTLQGIAALINADPARAREMLVTLASLLRTVLKHGSTDLIPLREELAFVRAYLSLEQMRLGNRLRVGWYIEPESLPSLIPQLLLQPLVENAIVHGAAAAPAGGSIELRARLEGDRLLVRITNTLADSTRPGLGMGLANTRARLTYLYADDAELQFSLDPKARRAVASVTLPALRTCVARPKPEAIVEGQLS
jgi:two-component system, LytTR family, sensor kinase